MPGNTLVTRSAGLIEAEVDGELVGLHLDNDTCYGFNRTATRIWGLLEKPRTISNLCETLMAEFNVSRELCERQLLELLEDLRQDGLVELSDTRGAAD